MARAAMALAAACMGERRAMWADAMRAELDEAAADGRALPFATGCLWAAWRELPAQAAGRALLGRYALAIGVVLPLAALLLFVATSGATGIVNDGNRAAAPVVAQLIAALAVLRVAVAWAMLDRDWGRCAALERLSAATLVALIVLAGLALLDATCAILPVAVVIGEAAMIRALARLHDGPEPAYD